MKENETELTEFQRNILNNVLGVSDNKTEKDNEFDEWFETFWEDLLN